MAKTKRRRIRSADWYSISESQWEPLIRRRFPLARLRIVRVRPGTAAYEDVVALRYAGFVESGFLDPRRDTRNAMRLPRDEDSIILALYRGHQLLATVTLNTPTRRFPGMAMELEKHVTIDHAYFRDSRALEITKLVVDPSARGMRIVLAMLVVIAFIARIFGKHHLWQVSRDVPADVSWRAGLGFDYSLNVRFRDPALNGMPSRVGYMHLPTAARDPRVPAFVREIYAGSLGIEAEAARP
ncbi:MAG TPA: hypothetical protein VHE79_09115 [Spirochaetia bacterium]